MLDRSCRNSIHSSEMLRTLIVFNRRYTYLKSECGFSFHTKHFYFLSRYSELSITSRNAFILLAIPDNIFHMFVTICLKFYCLNSCPTHSFTVLEYYTVSPVEMVGLHMLAYMYSALGTLTPLCLRLDFSDQQCSLGCLCPQCTSTEFLLM